ncbi:type II toxin-antitoxin system TacA family antitoxin [Serratia fonticola]
MQSTVRKPMRDKQINVRATEEERAVIDYAASLVNKNRTDFIIERAFLEAQNIILDQRVFVLDDARYQAFIEQLEAPVQNIEGRKRLIEVKPEWK